jgi:VWFA-related protein
MKHSWGPCGVLLCYLLPAAMGQQPAGAGAPVKGPIQVAPAQAAPVTSVGNPAAHSGRGDRDVHLDVMVTDKAGKPAPGLGEADFTVLDNDQPRKILSFEAHKPEGQAAEPPTEVIILFDTVNVPFESVSYARRQVQAYLGQNGGHLSAPVSIYFLTDTTVVGERQASTDGKAIAEQLEATESRLRAQNREAGVWAYLERFEYSTKMMSEVMEMLQNKPGRKLLIWVGPGWPMLDGPGITFSTQQQQKLLANIVAFSTLMRQAQIDVYSISIGASDAGTYLYGGYLKGVRKVSQAQAPDLGLKVLAVESGGLALAPSNDLTEALDTCMQDAGIYYSLAFEPPPADGPNDFHELKVRVDRPGLTARTNTGYYDQPDHTPMP